MAYGNVQVATRLSTMPPSGSSIADVPEFGHCATLSSAALTASRKRSPNPACCSSYQDQASVRSSSADGWNSLRRRRPETVNPFNYLIPASEVHASGGDLRGASCSLLGPELLDQRAVRHRVIEACQQPRCELRALGRRELQSLFQEQLGCIRHGAIVPRPCCDDPANGDETREECRGDLRRSAEPTSPSQAEPKARVVPLDGEQPVVLGDALPPGGRAGLDLAAPRGDGQVGDEGVGGLP